MSDDSVTRLNAALDGRYHIEREVGRGGMATVYLARDAKHDRHVALKVIDSELNAAEGADRFRSEIKTTASLNHPNILPLFDSGVVDGNPYYLMPVVEGDSLQDRLDREGSLSPAAAARIAAAAARALEYAHGRGIVHRDIKPSNILLQGGHTLIADFGISLVTGAESRLTMTGASLGTPHYMSPEQLDESRDPDGRSDQYALACVLFEMLEGHPPFPKRSAHAVLSAHLTQPPPKLSSTTREATALSAVVERAMSKSADDRFPSLTAFAEAVEAAVAPAETGGRGPRRGIVVLPFTNMSADPDDEYFSDGLTEEVIGDLSRIEGLRVISRTSAMQYKGTSLRLPQIAQELGVRYALEGGVRKAGNRLRVSAQFIDTETEEHLWSERFDGVMDDVFEIQDQVSAAIAEALSIVLTPAEKKAMQDRRMPDAEALDHYMRAQQAAILFEPDRMKQALIELEALLEEREDHMALLRGAAYLRWQMVNAGVSADPAHFRKVDEYIERMEALEPGTPWATAFRGMKKVFGAARRRSSPTGSTRRIGVDGPRPSKRPRSFPKT
jgi:serine/threonine protein kinase